MNLSGIALALACCGASAAQADWTQVPDGQRFLLNNGADLVNGVVVQPDGKIVIIGEKVETPNE